MMRDVFDLISTDTSRVFYPDVDEFGSEQGHEEADEMSVELRTRRLVKAFEVRQSQDEDLSGVPLGPVPDGLEKSLSQWQKGVF